jgi:DNA-binding NtrC family response regulator
VAYTAVRVVTAASTRAEASPADDLLVNVEREHIQRAWMRARGNKKAAARMLGLSRRALYRRLERLDLGDTISRRRDPVLEAVSA